MDKRTRLTYPDPCTCTPYRLASSTEEHDLCCKYRRSREPSWHWRAVQAESPFLRSMQTVVRQKALCAGAGD
jgi:hypothetical protein